jgi:hypothetical protein
MKKRTGEKRKKKNNPHLFRRHALDAPVLDVDPPDLHRRQLVKGQRLHVQVVCAALGARVRDLHDHGNLVGARDAPPLPGAVEVDAADLEALAAAVDRSRLEERVLGREGRDGPVGPGSLVEHAEAARALLVG